ncbi:MAG: ribonuclease R [Lachnospiraceae bacterium]|nr:ribonuclease R [Lachnospiraceae bacterium]
MNKKVIKTTKKKNIKETGKRKAVKVYEGILTTNRKGFGFVSCEGMEEDIFIPRSKMNGAFHLDQVKVELINGHGRRSEGRILKVLKRGIKQLIGTYQECRGFGFVVPDNIKIADDIHIAPGMENKAADGEKVVVKILSYGGDRKSPEGRITEVLGDPFAPGVDILSVVRAHELPFDFDDEVKAASEAVSLKIKKSELKGRRDLRDIMMVTIDGEDSKDLDDAVSLTMKGKDYILGVHIADVSHYVKEDSVLDKEALKRGTSVYLPGKVIPMLPERLSNGICSLNAGEDRLAMSCIMRITANGVIKSYDICESVINVNRRMTYTKVAAILEAGDKALLKEYKAFNTMFKRMERLALALKKMRNKRGAIDFDLPESSIELDDEGRVTDIKAYERNSATSMIEQFMLSANECVAGYMLGKALPFIYRIHETPDADRMGELMDLLRSFGYNVKGDPAKIKPKEVQRLIANCLGKPEEDLVRSLSLRSMKQARYSTECIGHFGLAAKEYTHFTSPIRRYPDLQIHRILKEQLHDKLRKKRIAHYEAILEGVANKCSECERKAVDAERDADKMKMAEYMLDHLGEEFEAVISGVTGWGMYVQLPNTVEGMVPVSKIPGDDFSYSEKEHALVGRFSGVCYRLGQKVTVKAKDVDKLMHTIDFELAWKDKRGHKKKNEKRRNKTRRK